MCGRMAESRDEGVVQRIERAIAIAQHREERAVNPREPQPVKPGPAFCCHHGPLCNATSGPFSLVPSLSRNLRELFAHDLCRFNDSDALLDAFFDRSRLEPAVGVRPELLRRDVAETLA